MTLDPTHPLGVCVHLMATISWTGFINFHTIDNEMVSLGDTAISLHIIQLPLTGGGFCKRSDLDSGKKIRDLKCGGWTELKCQNPKCQDLSKFPFGGCKLKCQNLMCQDLSKFQFGGGELNWNVKTQSAKICLNFNLGEECELKCQNLKCQDLSKFQFSRRGELNWNAKTLSAKICLNFNFLGGELNWNVKTQSAKICLNFNFQGGGVVNWNVKTQSAKICLNFNFQGGGWWTEMSKPKVPRSV